MKNLYLALTLFFAFNQNAFADSCELSADGAKIQCVLTDLSELGQLTQEFGQCFIKSSSTEEYEVVCAFESSLKTSEILLSSNFEDPNLIKKPENRLIKKSELR
jgi:hypothetical protein